MFYKLGYCLVLFYFNVSVLILLVVIVMVWFLNDIVLSNVVLFVICWVVMFLVGL